MRIVLVGAGVVGFHLAEQLSGEGHDISVVDNDPALVKRIDEKMDVLAGELVHDKTSGLLRSLYIGAPSRFLDATLRSGIHPPSGSFPV